jgi:molybdopterin-guanine dinucleotide biosynthesis protein MobB
MAPDSISIPAVAFVGRSNSGKTTLLVQVITELVARGVKVGTIKHHSHVGFDIDYEGKDSWRHRQAGSSYVVVSSPDQLASIRDLEQELEAEQIVADMDGVDIVLVEGYRKSSLPTVELFRSGNPKDVDRAVGGEGNEIIAVVTDIPRVEQEARAQGIMIFSFENILEIASFIEKRILGIITRL